MPGESFPSCVLSDPIRISTVSSTRSEASIICNSHHSRSDMSHLALQSATVVASHSILTRVQDNNHTHAHTQPHGRVHPSPAIPNSHHGSSHYSHTSGHSLQHPHSHQQPHMQQNGNGKPVAKPVLYFTLVVQLTPILPPTTAASASAASSALLRSPVSSQFLSYRIEKAASEFEGLFHTLRKSDFSSLQAIAIRRTSTTPAPLVYIPPFPFSAHVPITAESGAQLDAWMEQLIQHPFLSKSPVLRDWFQVPISNPSSLSSSPSPTHASSSSAAGVAGAAAAALAAKNHNRCGWEDDPHHLEEDMDGAEYEEAELDESAHEEEEQESWIDSNVATQADQHHQHSQQHHQLQSPPPPSAAFKSPSPTSYASASTTPPLSASPPPSTSPVSLQSFQLLRVIGKGSFGKVMLVRKIDSGRIYAMKSLEKEAVIRRNQIEHTRTERNVMSYVKHPFIVRLRFAFQSMKRLYFVLDFAAGGELFFHLGRAGRFSEHRAKFYAAEIVLAIEYLHSKNIIYRDLKPENVLLDKDGHIRLSDFGLSKEGMTQSSLAFSFCGTPEYLAPELLLRSGHGRAADWWSLGALLYEMLTGLPPFYSRNRDKLFHKILNQPLHIPRFFSPAAQALMEALLDRNPETRLGSTDDAAEIKSHEFFRDIDWEKLLAKKLKPPFQPTFNRSAAAASAADAAANGHASSIPCPASMSSATTGSSAVTSPSSAAAIPDTSNFDAEFTSLPLTDAADPEACLGTADDGDDISRNGASRDQARQLRTVSSVEREDAAKFPGFTFVAEHEFSPSLHHAIPTPLVKQQPSNPFRRAATQGVATGSQVTAASGANRSNPLAEAFANRLSMK